MGDSVEFQALRAKFYAQAERAASAGGGSSRPYSAGHLPETSDNGLVRSKVPPAAPKPVFPVNPSNEPRRFAQNPQGVFPKPPPSQRLVVKAEPIPPINDSENTRRVKLTGELLQNKMLQHLEKKPQASPRLLLPSQRSFSDVAPLRKPLPNVGQRPTKPKRPPSVNLDRFWTKGPGRQPTVYPDSKTQEGPPRPPKSAFMSATPPITQRIITPKQDTYDDIDLPPPPPPPPKPSSSGSWTSSFSSQADEESDNSEIYEHIENQEETALPVVLEKKKQKDHKRQQEIEKREQKERLKKETEYRKRFKLTGEVEVLHTAWVRENWQGGKNDLCVRQGETVQIVRVKNNPEGRWLARNMNGEYGYISNTCVDVDYEEIKRKIRIEAAHPALPIAHLDEEVYDDVGTDPVNSSLNVSSDVYDDVDHVIPDEFPLPPPEICRDPPKNKKLEKEEKEFRKRFKFEGPIQVLCCMMVDPNANIKKGSGKDLTVAKGEILEVIQQTNKKKVLCRNNQGKYGYVPRHYLLHEENDEVRVVSVLGSCRLVLSLRCKKMENSFEAVVNLLESYRGRDKVIRTICYASQLVGGIISRKTSSQLGRRLMLFSAQLSHCRTVLRLFDDLSMAAYSLRYGLGFTEEDVVLRCMSVLINVADQLYYPCEHVAWAADAQLIKVKSDKWWTLSTVLWAVSLLLGTLSGNTVTTVELQKQIWGEFLNILSSLADLSNAIHWMPPGFLWAGHFPDWLVGLLGTASSLLGMLHISTSN
ncbi:Peroxisomal membrane protein 11C [Bagarius yarrelli]|uniref:Peroxisomal membrane protein 11C n=1 Tax=Bagarius yarrelli TaxID=175774 RepID=A0A556U5L5_BAGYA|nr:Peroxisomal membrane protein 11C [Bagarius yarrelli]